MSEKYLKQETVDKLLQFYKNHNRVRNNCVVINKLDDYLNLLNNNKDKKIKYTYPDEENGFSLILTEKCSSVINDPEMIFVFNCFSLPFEFINDNDMLEAYRSIIRIIDHEINRYNLLSDDQIIYYIISQEINCELDNVNQSCHLYNSLSMFYFD